MTPLAAGYEQNLLLFSQKSSSYRGSGKTDKLKSCMFTLAWHSYVRTSQASGIICIRAYNSPSKLR